MLDAAAIGEVLIDFTPSGADGNGFPRFTSNPGGAPANVVAALAKWGRTTAFIGKVGQDAFGTFLRDVLDREGVQTDGMVFTDAVPTTLAFVHLNGCGDRSFSFYRSPGADMMLREDEVHLGIAGGSRLFHFGSVSLTDEPAASATLYAVQHAKQCGAVITYDPNLRIPLWKNLSLAKERMRTGLAHADIVKLSEEELFFLTDKHELAEGTADILNEFQTPLLLVTLGSEGCFFRLGEVTGSMPGYPVQSVDTTGAGDMFFAGILYGFLKRSKDLQELTSVDIAEMAGFANAAGALAVTKKGAIPSIPSLQAIEELRRGFR